jgi:hypothetical protein
MNTINAGHDFVLLSIGSQIMKSQKKRRGDDTRIWM